MWEPNSGCLIWIGAQISYGYGHGHRDGIHFYAHRSAFEAANGEGSAFGLVVRHQCDFPPCCNPDHLLSGTHLDNAADAKARNRLNPLKGELVHFAKLVTADVLLIRKMAADGWSINQITELYPVNRNAITDAVTGASWAHLPGKTDFAHIKTEPPHYKGEKAPRAILTDQQAAEIKISQSRGVDLAEQYGVHPSTISAIRTGRIRK